MIDMKVERKGLAINVGKNPAVVMGHLLLFKLCTTGGKLVYRLEVSFENINFSKVSNELLKTENTLVPNCLMGFLVHSVDRLSHGLWSFRPVALRHFLSTALPFRCYNHYSNI